MIIRKALREGFHEREWDQMVYLQERRINTKRNLARATTKSKSKTQTVSMDCQPMVIN